MGNWSMSEGVEETLREATGRPFSTPAGAERPVTRALRLDAEGGLLAGSYRSFQSCHANPYPRTPAMAAEVADHVWKFEETVRLLG